VIVDNNKRLLKTQKRIISAAKDSDDQIKIAEAEKRLFCTILCGLHHMFPNSFYGYVIRTGARWYSMEMAGIVTQTGGLIIRRAKEFIDCVRLFLGLDTDGTWSMLPMSFPDTFSFQTRSGKSHNSG
jgi:DNA polymerase epsilon subunit 1